MKIPSQLQNIAFRFIKLKEKSKVPIEEKWQIENNYQFDGLQDHPGNIGVVGGYGKLRILDADNKEFAEEIKQKLPKTFTVKTGSGGLHFYLISDYNKNHVFVDNKGELRCKNYQVVIPGSIHPCGAEYKVIEDLPIAEINSNELKEILKPYLRPEIKSASESLDKPKDPTRSGKEFREVIKLIGQGKTKEEVFKEMAVFKKWSDAPSQYREHTFNKAKSYVDSQPSQEKVTKKSKKIVVVDRFSPQLYAEQIFEKTNFLYDKFKRFWRYDNKTGEWKEDAEAYINHILRRELLGETEQRKRICEEVVAYIRDLHYKSEDIPKLPLNIIPFHNCLYDLKEDKMLDFSPKYFVTNKIAAIYNPDLKYCPKIDKFFDDVVGLKHKKTLYEIPAYSLYRGFPYQKIFILYGPGLNGKGVYSRLLTRFLGVENISSETPHELINNRFSKGNLWNKLANISSDIPYTTFKNTNTLKQLTGEDFINCERKFKTAFPFTNHAKPIYSTNQLPQTSDKTLAWYRRIYLIGFPNIFKNPDRALLNKLTTKEELTGFTYQCVEHVKGLLNNNFAFTIDPDISKVAEVYEDLSNPILKFIKEKCADDIDNYIYKFEFQDRFLAWLKDSGFRVWNHTEVGMAMKQHYEEKRKGENKYWSWLGLRWKDRIKDFGESSKEEAEFVLIKKEAQDVGKCGYCGKIGLLTHKDLNGHYSCQKCAGV